ncbi:MAG: transglutaminase family protein, partial [Myxococcota bacterium]
RADAADGPLGDRPELSRPPLDSVATPDDGPRDLLAETGLLLVAVGTWSDDSQPAADRTGIVQVELPALRDPAELCQWLDIIARAALAAEVRGLVLTGFPPPVDYTVRWATVTPDPGVLEINMAPTPCVAEYFTELRCLYQEAATLELSPVRRFFNGEESESGGGGHLTLGGRSAQDSPFFVHPRLLPRLVAYFNRHPALSYAFAPDSLGSSSQAPRPDEVCRESLGELDLAIHRLCRGAEPAPDTLWATLAPLLSDRFGNTHRCEINVEKLWNPYLPLRGRMGVVEFRAQRMHTEPERTAAVAALFRAIAASLAGAGRAPAQDAGQPALLQPTLIDWGNELHDRFALPHFLRR